MTLLLTRCDGCGENFMLADTEALDGTCYLCGRKRRFTKEEIGEAETERDRLSEKYVERMQKAYDEKDPRTVAELAKEAGKAGVSSWFAWFFIGWADMSEGKAADAFKDFELSVSFLDEENLDEFCDLVMDACLERLDKAVKDGELWLDTYEPLFGFDDALMERFGDVIEFRFVTELVSRMGFMEVGKDSEGRVLAASIAYLAFVYAASDMYLPDHQDVMEAASGALESLRSMDGPFNETRTLAETMADAISRVSEMENAVCEEHEDCLDALCDHWIDEDDGHGDVLMDVCEESLKFGISGRRNRGAKNKMDEALEKYRKLLNKAVAVAAERADEMQDGPEDLENPYEGVYCPECGRFVPAGPGGLLECKCGFRGRAVTKAIEDLPDDLESLHKIAGEAYLNRDSEALNNVGEHILGFDGTDWRGCVSLAFSCALDGNLPIALDVLTPCMGHVDEKDAGEFAGKSLELISYGMANATREDDLMSIIPLETALRGLPDTERPTASELAERIMDKGFSGFYPVALTALTAKAMALSLGSRVRPLKDVHDALNDIVGLQKAALTALNGVKAPDAEDRRYIKQVLDDNVSSLDLAVGLLDEAGKEDFQGSSEGYSAVMESIAGLLIEDETRGRDQKKLKKQGRRLAEALESYMKG
ncbi:MAG: hypothetical protein IKH98_07825 [Candidatus Methanomethylophilaceae archaeon]|nr:hypothetical protein [Candidatus Methanomethylophilaceae archaeon]